MPIIGILISYTIFYFIYIYICDLIYMSYQRRLTETLMSFDEIGDIFS